MFINELKEDSKFLRNHNINDYSLLVGIHSKDEKNKRSEVEELNPNFNGKDNHENPSDPEDSIRRMNSNSQMGMKGENRMPPYMDYPDGGILSEDGKETYYMGIIDILTEFSFAKKLEYVGKSMTTCSQKFSCLPPDNYQKRFVRFTNSIIKGDDGVKGKD